MSRFFSGNKDADRIILQNLNDRDLLSACSVGKYALELCNEDFFKNRLMEKYPDAVKYKNMKSWKQYYLATVFYVSKMKEESDFDYKTGDPKAYYDILHNNLMVHIFFERVGEINARDLYEEYSKDRLAVYTAHAMKGAAKNNHKDFIEYLIKEGKSYQNNLLNFGLEGAVESNNMELIDFFIKKGADKFEQPLYIASRNGNIDLIELFIDRGDLNQAMAQAAGENQKEAVEFLIEKGANDYLLGMIGAAGGGNLDLLKYLIEKGQGTPVTKNYFYNLERRAHDGKIGITKTVQGEKKYDEVIEFIHDLKKRNFD